MDTFIITGANAEPAQSIARRLCEMGARVYGIAGTFPETDFAFNEFFPVACDVTSPAAVAVEIEKILEREKTISGLIFSMQYLSCEAFEAMTTEEITLAVNALVSAPLVIASLALPSLIASRGSLIAVSPNTVTPHGHVLNNITDAAMKVFAGTLFGELRDTGVKTCHIFLQNNTGAQDPAAAYAKAPQSRIQPDIVAETVETVLRLRENNALTQIVLRPQATRETPLIPVSSEPRIRTLQVVRLPETKNYPPTEEPILTPKYRRPDYAPPRGQKALDAAEEALADDEAFADDYVDPELRYLVKTNAKRENLNPAPAEESENPASGETSEVDESVNTGRRKRKRRRKKKNRNGAILIQAPQLGGVENSVSSELPDSQETLKQTPPSERTMPAEKERENPLSAETKNPPSTPQEKLPAETREDPKEPEKKSEKTPLKKRRTSSRPRTGKPKSPAPEESSEKPQKKPRKARKPKPEQTGTDSAVV